MKYVITVALLLIAAGAWTWFGPIGQSPAQIGPSLDFLVGLGAGVIGLVMLVAVFIAALVDWV